MSFGLEWQPPGTVMVDGREIRISSGGWAMPRLFQALYDASPRWISGDDIMEAIYGLERRWPEKSLHVLLVRLRRSFVGTSLRIETWYTVGYRLIYDPPVSALLAWMREETVRRAIERQPGAMEHHHDLSQPGRRAVGSDTVGQLLPCRARL